MPEMPIRLIPLACTVTPDQRIRIQIRNPEHPAGVAVEFDIMLADVLHASLRTEPYIAMCVTRDVKIDLQQTPYRMQRTFYRDFLVRHFPELTTDDEFNGGDAVDRLNGLMHHYEAKQR